MTKKANALRKADRASVRRSLDEVVPTIKGILARYHWWEVAFLVIGILSAIAISVLLFLPWGNGPERFAPSGTVAAAGSPQFLDTLSASLNLPIERGPPVQILNNGDAFLNAVVNDIDHAKHSINFMVYIWQDGTLSDVILSHLAQSCRRGVQVRIMLDAYGAIGAPSEKMDRLRALGARVATFHSLMPLPWTMARDHKRNHRRAIVIDGSIAYTGGIAASDTWLGNARNVTEWRDMMFRVQGTMAKHLQGSFAELWAGTTGEVLVGEAFYPSPNPVQSAGLTYVPLASSPSPDSFAMENFMLLSILSARHDIDLVTPYFLADDSIKDALLFQAKHGVRIRILVPNDNNDEKSVRYASQYTYEDFLRGGVQIVEFQPTFNHTKLLIVDGVWSVIGSANMDNRSRKLNEEVVFGIADAKFAHALQDILAADFRRSQRVRLSAWTNRSWWQRLLEAASRAFVQQY